MDPQLQQKTAAHASAVDTARIFKTVLAPTLAKGVIKRRPPVEAAVQHHELDTKALRLLQELCDKYGSGPLILDIPLRPQVLLLDPIHVQQVLKETPVPFSTASQEKQSALAHFEPGHILISIPCRRAKLRPVHEGALATSEPVHPCAEHFRALVERKLQPLLSDIDSNRGTELNWSDFVQAWFKVVRTIVLGEGARDDEGLTEVFDDIRQRGNWGFLASKDNKLESFKARMAKYLQRREKGSLVSRLPRDDSNLELEMQAAHWLFAFEPAGMAAFRALALLACQPGQQEQAVKEINGAKILNPFSRSVILESLRLWPTTPVILGELTKDYDLGGETIEKGTGVIIFAPFFHRDNEQLDSADRMAPRNWAAEGTLPSAGLVLFSSGPGICPAHNLVPMVTSFALDAILSKARVDLIQPLLDPNCLPGTLDHFEIKLRLFKRTDVAA